MILTSILLVSGTSYGQTDCDKAICTRLKLDLGAEYLHPTKESRPIHTVSANTFFGWEWGQKVSLALSGGLTTTYAWGSINRSNDFGGRDTFENRAFGIGPAFLLKFKPYIYKGFSLSPEFSAGVIFYSEGFPAGGDFYNFMLRAGVSANYQSPNGKYGFVLAFKWMHVSNGQGLIPENPSYEGRGVGFTVVKYLGVQPPDD